MSAPKAPETQPMVRSGYLATTLLAVAFAALVDSTSSGIAQDYPSRPITLVVPIAAGGGVDAVARVIAPELEKRLGKPVVVDNRPGAATQIGALSVSRSAPDGYTLMTASSSTLAINPALYKKLQYNPLRDFTHISFIAEYPFGLLVHPSLGVSSIAELISLAKRQPGMLSFASVGIGSEHHIFAESLKRQTGIDIQHVPYRGASPALVDVLAGRVPVLFGNIDQVQEYLQNGRLKMLAVVAPQRLQSLPDVPTLAEAGLTGFDTGPWISLVGPANMPLPVVAKINEALREFMKSDSLKQFNAGKTASFRASTPEELRDLLMQELTRWGTLVKASGASLE